MIRFLTILTLFLTSLNLQALETVLLKRNNTYTFRGPVTWNSISHAQSSILKLDSKLPKDEPIYLVLDTPGGSVFAGKAFLDAMKSIDREIKTVTMDAASMGFIFVQHLGERLITPTGSLMSHRASGGVRGQFNGELESRLKYYKSVFRHMEKIVADRVGLSLEEYQKAIINEWWSYGEEALDDNLADKLVNIKCSRALLKHRIKLKVSSFFGSYEVVYSGCPLISGPVDDDVKNEDE